MVLYFVLITFMRAHITNTLSGLICTVVRLCNCLVVQFEASSNVSGSENMLKIKLSDNVHVWLNILNKHVYKIYSGLIILNWIPKFHVKWRFSGLGNFHCIILKY